MVGSRSVRRQLAILRLDGRTWLLVFSVRGGVRCASTHAVARPCAVAVDVGASVGCGPRKAGYGLRGFGPPAFGFDSSPHPDVQWRNRPYQVLLI